jgi:hypothetical protein
VFEVGNHVSWAGADDLLVVGPLIAVFYEPAARRRGYWA